MLFRSIAMTAVGIVLAAAPLALWVAWTEAIFFAVLGAIVVCAALFVLLAEAGHSLREYRLPADATRAKAELTDEFVAEVHRIFPPVYHNARLVTGRFRRTMEKLQGLVPR